jgi:hypothetical protein
MSEASASTNADNVIALREREFQRPGTPFPPLLARAGRHHDDGTVRWMPYRTAGTL